MPGLTDEAAIERLTGALDAPVNVLAGPPLARLGELGVARVSTGSALFRIALGAALHAAEALRAGDGLDAPEAPSYAEVDALARP